MSSECRSSCRKLSITCLLIILVEVQVQHRAFSFFFTPILFLCTYYYGPSRRRNKRYSEHSFVQKRRALSHNPNLRESFITIIHQASFIPCVPSSFPLLFFLSLLQQAMLAADHLASPSRLHMARSIMARSIVARSIMARSIAPNWSASARSARSKMIRSPVLLNKYFHPPVPQNASLGFD
jgi:hypothetical protein